MSAFCYAFDKMRGRDTLTFPVSSGGLESNPLSILKNVLFVCTGNTCRSPMAEALFRDLVKERVDYQVSSAGVAAAPGMPASKHTAALLKERGLDLARFQSRMLDRQILEQATHVFAMSSHHMAAIVDEFPAQADKVYLVSEFSAEDALRGRDVSDPFGQGRSAYEETLRSLEKMLPSLLAYIDQTWKKNDG
jgi:protein-tyrosine phosphatase